MTDGTALQISSMLLDLLKQHGFDCVGTFNLPRFSADAVFDEYKEDYKYMDTDIGFNDLRRTGTIEGEAVFGLRQVIDVTLEYFETAVSIPTKFNEAMAQLSNQPQTLPLVVNDINQQSVNLNEIIINDNSRQLIQLLLLLRENLDEPDEVVLSRLDQIN